MPLRGVNLKNANLMFANLTRRDLTGAELPWANCCQALCFYFTPPQHLFAVGASSVSCKCRAPNATAPPALRGASGPMRDAPAPSAG